MRPFTLGERAILNYMEGKPIEREVLMLGYVQEEVVKKEKKKVDKINYDLTTIGTEVEIPTTIDCDKHCDSPDCKVFFQSDLISRAPR